jgi:[acyl-carrier-protein] S-malonyltransferase
MNIALVFPGQGAQYAGMGLDLYEAYPIVRALYEEASATLGYDVPLLCFDDPDEVISQTEYTQPLLLTACVAAYETLRNHVPSLSPCFVAGLSLGEYAALVVASCLSFTDALRLAQIRGRIMQEAVPVGTGAMAAIIGLDATIVEQLCSELSTADGLVQPANYNCPGQIVVSGHTPKVRSICRLARERGAAKAVLLPVSAPFHSRLLNPAALELGPYLDAQEFQDAAVPVVANVSARPICDGGQIRGALKSQIASPVLMEQSLRFLASHGTDLFIELGPGDTVSKLVKNTVPGAMCLRVGDLPTLNDTVERLRTIMQ